MRERIPAVVKDFLYEVTGVNLIKTANEFIPVQNPWKRRGRSITLIALKYALPEYTASIERSAIARRRNNVTHLNTELIDRMTALITDNSANFFSSNYSFAWKIAYNLTTAGLNTILRSRARAREANPPPMPNDNQNS